VKLFVIFIYKYYIDNVQRIVCGHHTISFVQNTRLNANVKNISARRTIRKGEFQLARILFGRLLVLAFFYGILNVFFFAFPLHDFFPFVFLCGNFFVPLYPHRFCNGPAPQLKMFSGLQYSSCTVLLVN
jgi:hypothetical protein